MGAGNVVLTFANWSHLPDRPFRALLYMAIVSMDTDSPPRYFGGYPALANALGRECPARLDRASAGPDERRQWKAHMEAVRNAVSPLVAAGAIAVDRPESPGQGPEFALFLARPAGSCAATVQASPAERSRLRLPTVQASPADLGGEGGGDFARGVKRNTEGTTSPNVTTSLAKPRKKAKGRKNEADERKRQHDALTEWENSKSDPHPPLDPDPETGPETAPNKQEGCTP